MSIPKDFQKAIELHNNYRRSHNVKDLIWDNDIAEIAQKYAEELVQNNKLIPKNSNYMGQNVSITLCYKYLSLAEKVCNAINIWYKEIDLYDFANPSFTMKTKNFTQLVWANTEKIGIGIATKENKIVVIANYFPAGNIYNLFSNNVFPLIENSIKLEKQIQEVKKITISNIYSTLDTFSKKDGRGNFIIPIYNSTEINTFSGYELIPKVSFIEEFPADFRIEGSNDNGQTWEVLDRKVAVTRESRKYTFSKNESYKIIQLVITRTSFKKNYGYGRFVSLNQFNLFIT